MLSTIRNHLAGVNMHTDMTMDHAQSRFVKTNLLLSLPFKIEEILARGEIISTTTANDYHAMTTVRKKYEGATYIFHRMFHC